MAREINDRLGDIRQAIEDIDRFIFGLSFHDFAHNKMVYRACLSALAESGEAVKGLPDDYRRTHPHIPWQAIGGMRDIIVHEYFRTDAEIIWASVSGDDLNHLRLLLSG
jgi:uncharacterized protein with HEPN domain